MDTKDMQERALSTYVALRDMLNADMFSADEIGDVLFHMNQLKTTFDLNV